MLRSQVAQVRTLLVRTGLVWIGHIVSYLRKREALTVAGHVQSCSHRDT